MELVLSSNSYIGKSTVQQNLKIFFSIISISSAIFILALPANFAASSNSLHTKNIASPSLALEIFFILVIASIDKNLAIGPLDSPSEKTIYPKPG